MTASKNYSLKLILTFPRAHTPICDTELTALAREQQFLHDVGVEVLVQTADEPAIVSQWLTHSGVSLDNFRVLPPPKDEKGLEDLSTSRYTSLIALRDNRYPEEKFLYGSRQDADIGRNIGEIIRIIEAALTEEPCPEGWRAGNKTFKDKFTCEK